ncbi:MAG: hypothetical protein M1493_04060 [Firmicutes bacterium]|nr:hypothetical protein [Bacillota bacterium]
MDIFCLFPLDVSTLTHDVTMSSLLFDDHAMKVMLRSSLFIEFFVAVTKGDSTLWISRFYL